MKSAAIYLKQALLVVMVGILLAVLPIGTSGYATKVGERDMTQDRPSQLWQEGKERTAQSATVGGPCAYRDMPGDALITNIEKTPELLTTGCRGGRTWLRGFRGALYLHAQGADC